jgi:hypothetical protein
MKKGKEAVGCEFNYERRKIILQNY